MIKIDDSDISEGTAIYYANCLTCNDPANMVLNIVTTPDKYKAMILANHHLLENGQGHQINITYSIN